MIDFQDGTISMLTPDYISKMAENGDFSRIDDQEETN